MLYLGVAALALAQAASNTKERPESKSFIK
jgi:hypothetical protein